MDHFSKALEHAEREGHSVRKWVQPTPVGAEAATNHPATEISGRTVRLNLTKSRKRHLLTGHETEDLIIADKYRLLRTKLLQRMKAHNWKRLAITSPGAKNGKTITSINLAISIARDGSYRVVLIDADLRKPSVGMELGIETERGLIDHLAFQTPIDEIAVIPEDIPNLTIIPGRRVTLNEASPELLGSKLLYNLIDCACNDTRPTIVIVDLPPLFLGDDVIQVAEHLDGVLLVIEEGSTEVEELKTAAELLQPYNLLGSVLNKSAERTKGFSGYYHPKAESRKAQD